MLNPAEIQQLNEKQRQAAASTNNEIVTLTWANG
jgi:hypothetical protein